MGSLYLCVFGEGMTRWVEGGQMKWEPGKEEKDKKTEKKCQTHLQIKSCICISKKKLRGSLFRSLNLKKKPRKYKQ